MMTDCSAEQHSAGFSADVPNGVSCKHGLKLQDHLHIKKEEEDLREKQETDITTVTVKSDDEAQCSLLELGQRFAAEHTGSPAPESEKTLLGAISGLSCQLTKIAESVAAINTRMSAMETRMASLEEAVVQSRSPSCDTSGVKRRRRAHNTKIAATVRLLHNSEGNEKRYDPIKGMSSPHNSAVTSYLVKTLSTSPEMRGVDTGVFISACKTYYETVRRNFRFGQPDFSAQAEAMKGAARSRQRRKRLLGARTTVLTKDEIDFWRGITVDMMSDEEDGTADGEAGWIVRPPSFRSQELSELCSTLQKRLENDPKYQATHHKRLHYGPPSKRPAPSYYDSEAAKRHLLKF